MKYMTQDGYVYNTKEDVMADYMDISRGNTEPCNWDSAWDENKDYANEDNTMTTYTVIATEDKLVYILRINRKEVETIHLPRPCILLTDEERLRLIYKAVTKRFGE